MLVSPDLRGTFIQEKMFIYSTALVGGVTEEVLLRTQRHMITLDHGPKVSVCVCIIIFTCLSPTLSLSLQFKQNDSLDVLNALVTVVFKS